MRTSDRGSTLPLRKASVRVCSASALSWPPSSRSRPSCPTAPASHRVAKRNFQLNREDGARAPSGHRSPSGAACCLVAIYHSTCAGQFARYRRSIWKQFPLAPSLPCARYPRITSSMKGQKHNVFDRKTRDRGSQDSVRQAGADTRRDFSGRRLNAPRCHLVITKLTVVVVALVATMIVGRSKWPSG